MISDFTVCQTGALELDTFYGSTLCMYQLKLFYAKLFFEHFSSDYQNPIYDINLTHGIIIVCTFSVKYCVLVVFMLRWCPYQAVHSHQGKDYSHLQGRLQRGV